MSLQDIQTQKRVAADTCKRTMAQFLAMFTKCGVVRAADMTGNALSVCEEALELFRCDMMARENDGMGMISDCYTGREEQCGLGHFIIYIM